ncbi:MAG: hypothetical protein LQ341_002458 [Variospora aurantia]|nr:MAG: hypothetical protein LQ341_002458 [Variospora aurantia]
MLTITLLRPLAKILILPTLIDQHTASLKSLDLPSIRVLERPTLCHSSLSQAQCQVSWLAVAAVVTYNAARFSTTLFDFLWVIKPHSPSPSSKLSDDEVPEEGPVMRSQAVDHTDGSSDLAVRAEDVTETLHTSLSWPEREIMITIMILMSQSMEEKLQYGHLLVVMPTETLVGEIEILRELCRCGPV